uniref:Copia protein n=1 Tax=Bactrocera dorsalis TaxID=27457 RepID=A0A034WQA6_BACDO
MLQMWSTGSYKNQCRNKGKEKSTESQQQHMSFTVLAATDVGDLKHSSWFLDSGATAHMSGSRNIFTNYVTQAEDVMLADNNIIRAVGRSDVVVQTDFCELRLENVLHIPQIKGNFVSVSRAVKRDCTVSFNSENAIVSQNGEQILKAEKRNKLFVFECINNACFGAAQCSAEVWHNRYAT